ncbi:MAG: restriction endonuclease subunit S, partial [Bacteroidota bacterium]|nr:restriction endonuclease subunit S [Bacteroidota bacterium]
QALFIHHFGDPVQNPKNWQTKPLGELGSLNRGKSKHRPRNAPELLGGIYPLIQTGDVANCDGYITTYNQTYSEIGLKQSKMWDEGTLCITIAANIAKTGILKIKACFPDSIVGFIPNEKCNVEFIQFWFSFFQKILEEQAPESAQKNINLEILKELKIILPPLPLQEAFAQQIAQIEEQKALALSQATHSEELFQALLQESFSPPQP